MSYEYIQNYDYYNAHIQPDSIINPHSKGVVWNSNNSKQLKCCIDERLNRNRWMRFNPEIDIISDRLTQLENSVRKPDNTPPINGYKSQVIARYLVIDGDDGNGSWIAFGNRRITMSPHWYGEWAGGDEYGAVALMLRDIGYLGTITRWCTNVGINTVPKEITLSNGETRYLRHTGDWTYTYYISGGPLPLWPPSRRYGIDKVRYYEIPLSDPRLKSHLNFNPYHVTQHDYYDMLTAVPFPYDNYSNCKYYDSIIPTLNVTTWKAVDINTWNACPDPRKKVAEWGNVYLIPVIDPNSIPYNARDEGINGKVWAWNGFSISFFDVYYMGDIMK